MRLLLLAVLITGCGLSTVPVPDGGDAGGSAGSSGGGTGGGAGGGTGGSAGGGLGGGSVTVTPLFSSRSRLGARSAAGFRPWGGGIAVVDTWLYWVESAGQPALYRAPLAGCSGGGTCPEQVATLTRPSAFAATADSVLVADVTAIKRYPVNGAVQNIATASSEVVVLATDGQTAFWTTQSSPINRTPFGGVTSVPINSNGTPFAMTVAGPRVHWVGVDISGLQGAMQSMKTDGTNARADSSFSGGFQTMRGNASFLFYARDFPSLVFRNTLGIARLEQVATNAQGVKDFAIDATHAYWVEPGDLSLASGVLRRVSHESTAAEDVVTALAYPVAVTVNAGVVYVLSAGTQSASWADGRVLKITLQ